MLCVHVYVWRQFEVTFRCPSHAACFLTEALGIDLARVTSAEIEASI
jgi:hypothetical protein